MRSKKFAKIRLSTTGGGGFNADFCFAPLSGIAPPDITATRRCGFQILTK